MKFEIEMFLNPHLRGFIDAAANLLSRELPDRKCSMNLRYDPRDPQSGCYGR